MHFKIHVYVEKCNYFVANPIASSYTRNHKLAVSRHVSSLLKDSEIFLPFFERTIRLRPTRIQCKKKIFLKKLKVLYVHWEVICNSHGLCFPPCTYVIPWIYLYSLFQLITSTNRATLMLICKYENRVRSTKQQRYIPMITWWRFLQKFAYHTRQLRSTPVIFRGTSNCERLLVNYASFIVHD